MNLFELADNMKFLMDEGFLDDNFDYANGADVESINQSLIDKNGGGYVGEPQFIESNFLADVDKFKKILNAYSVN